MGGMHDKGVCVAGEHAWWRACIVGGGAWQEMATAASGTHPTGMHSCFEFVFTK